MNSVSGARSRFPKGAFDRVAEYRQERWREEREIRTDIQRFRQRMYEVVGMREEPTFLRVGVRYDVAACSALAAIIAKDPDPYRVECAVRANGVVTRWLVNMGCSVDNAGIQEAVRSSEFECWRRDREFLQCVAASEKSFEQLPQVMATTVAREHRYWEARRRLRSIEALATAASDEMLDDLDVDENDIAAALEKAGRDSG